MSKSDKSTVDGGEKPCLSDDQERAGLLQRIARAMADLANEEEEAARAIARRAAPAKNVERRVSEESPSSSLHTEEEKKR